jgi:hypothetical protein
MNEIFILLLLLFVKHYYIDFVNQSNDEIARKGIYGDTVGMDHSIKHGIATMFCIVLVTGPAYIAYAGILGFLDFVLHYHIDWFKMRYGVTDISNKAFWNHFGLDQLAHSATYLLIARLIL